MKVKNLILVFMLFVCGCAVKAQEADENQKNNNEAVNMFEEIVKYASLAPSGHNSQPWKFEIKDSVIIILPDYSRRLPAVDPEDREMFISIGCALENMVVAAGHFGYACKVEYLTENANNEAIKVTLAKTTEKRTDDLFNQIEKRQTTRNEYNRVKVAAGELNEITRFCGSEKASLCVKTDSLSINRVIQLVKSGNIVQFSDDAFMDELKFWIRFSHAEAEEKSDGLASDVMGNPSVPRWLGKIYMNWFYSADDQNEKDEKFIKSSAGVALFYTAGNNKADWIETGRAYERFSLLTTSKNIKCAFINQPIEVARFWDKTAESFGLKNVYPQLLLRFGYSEAMPKSPRRRLNDMIIK